MKGGGELSGPEPLASARHTVRHEGGTRMTFCRSDLPPRGAAYPHRPTVRIPTRPHASSGSYAVTPGRGRDHEPTEPVPECPRQAPASHRQVGSSRMPPRTAVENVVFSHTLTNLEWGNARLTTSDPASTVRKLRSHEGGDIVVLSSASIIRALLEAGEFDRLSGTLCPEIAGGGSRSFDDGPLRLRGRLVDAVYGACQNGPPWTMLRVAGKDQGGGAAHGNRRTGSGA